MTSNWIMIQFSDKRHLVRPMLAPLDHEIPRSAEREEWRRGINSTRSATVRRCPKHPVCGGNACYLLILIPLVSAYLAANQRVAT